MKTKKIKSNNWRSAGHLSFWDKIAQQTHASREQLKEQLQGIKTSGQKFSQTIINAGEMLLEASYQPVGRLAVATTALTIAWALL